MQQSLQLQRFGSAVAGRVLRHSRIGSAVASAGFVALTVARIRQSLPRSHPVSGMPLDLPRSSSAPLILKDIGDVTVSSLASEAASAARRVSGVTDSIT